MRANSPASEFQPVGPKALMKLKALGRQTRGAAVVELAIVTPILLTLAAVVVDMGLGWRTRQSLESAARSSARAGAAAVDSPQFADLAVLHEIYRGLSSDSETRDFINSDNLTEDSTANFLVSIYDPGLIGQIPPGCDEPPPVSTNLCNRFSLQDLRDSQSFKPGDPTYLTSGLYSKSTCATCYWPTSRSSGQTDLVNGQQFSAIGVHIRLIRKSFFKVTGINENVQAKSVFTLEQGAPDIPIVDTTTTTALPGSDPEDPDPSTPVSLTKPTTTTTVPGDDDEGDPGGGGGGGGPPTFTFPPITRVPPSIG